MSLCSKDYKIYIDVSSIIKRFAKGQLPTGIDRTLLAYIRHYHQQALAVVRLGKHYWTLPPHQSIQLLHLLCSKSLQRNTNSLLFRGILKQSFHEKPTHGFLLNIDYSGLSKARYVQMIKNLNLKPLFFVHDLIPITHPEYFPKFCDRRHKDRINQILKLAAGIIVNSQATQTALIQFAQQSNQTLPPILRAWLSSSFTNHDHNKRFIDAPYFVMLSTIEPRKNHLLLLQIWQKFAIQLGNKSPKLVIIGQSGWNNHHLLHFIEREPTIQNLIVYKSTCSDEELIQYMYHAQALLFPSFTEGYGLPLIEALAMNIPTIVSDIPVFREIAQNVPEYIDPTDDKRWAETILSYTTPDSPRRTEQLQRLLHFQTPSWDDHFEKVDAFIKNLSNCFAEARSSWVTPKELQISRCERSDGLLTSNSSSERSTTSNNLSKSPHPPYGHLLPVSGEKEERKKLFGRLIKMAKVGIKKFAKNHSRDKIFGSVQKQKKMKSFEINESFLIEGWVISTQGIECINVYIDNVLIGKAHYGVLRYDIYAAYPHLKNAGRSGFCYTVNQHLNLALGKHLIKIQAQSISGKTKTWTRTVSIIKPIKYQKWLSQNEPHILAALTSQQQKRIVRRDVESLIPCTKTPKISIIIPTRIEDVDCLEHCFSGLMHSTAYPNLEILILVNNLKDESLIETFLKKWPFTIFFVQGQFNWSKLNNFGARQATGDYFLFLNDDVQPLHDDWLNRMVNTIISSKAGAVGSLLKYPNGTIQHAGIRFTGQQFRHLFRFCSGDEEHLQWLLHSAREVSAVTGACLLTSRICFEENGGFDEALAIVYNDIDFCLRISQNGHPVIIEPRAYLTHQEGISRQGLCEEMDTEHFWKKWGNNLKTKDKFTNPHIDGLEDNWTVSENNVTAHQYQIDMDFNRELFL